MSYDEITFWQKSPTKACPMVWTHQSGRKSLLLGATADYVIGMPVEESRALLARLRDWATQPQYVYRHHGNPATCSSGTTPEPCTGRLPYRRRQRPPHAPHDPRGRRAPAVKLGIATPVVTNVAGAPLTWEKNATIEDIGRVAETADRLGYHHLTCSEHIGMPATEAGRRGARYWDPLATLGYVAARTTQIRLATMTLVLGYHHPLAIVKRYGTLDHVSGGRVILGVGVGSLKEEFDLLGAPFDDRGARADDALRALRAACQAMSRPMHGEFYSFGGLTVDPCALQPHMPIWIGGRTKRSLRRALTLADGWCPFNVLDRRPPPSGCRRFDLPDGFEVVLPADQPLDPVREPEATRETSGTPWPRQAPRPCRLGSSTTRSSITSSRFTRSPTNG